MKTMAGTFPEFLRLNKYLSEQVGIDENEQHIKKIIGMVC
ncbi:hypothetical protein EV207_115113 [Scopulibacillus darangshiensis]|uniref:Uncharacterized protein n=1 Tax=Scopulibacillus darangshiensis TaxID=442528 RepID=A0A4V2SMY3_9BACL|nr:hypothetical protein EV207_115113 [Scopulibacillus darangshiensis]